MSLTSPVRITEEDFDLRAEVAALHGDDGGTGAVASFVGVVRQPAAGAPLTALELEHYPGMTEHAIEAMVEDAIRRFGLRAARVVHRVGRLAPGAQIVLVAVSAAHRHAAFQGCEFLMDYLKTQAPFWKKEEGADGQAQWVDARVEDDAALARWGVQPVGNASAVAPAAAPALPPLQALELRQALGRFATGVAIISCRSPEGQAIGLTVNSFSALSLEPPLVLWSLRQSSSAAAAFVAARHFAVNVLSQDQVELSRRFAGSGIDKFGDAHWQIGREGLPLLNGAAATFECTRRSHQIAGDHLLFIGEVLHFGQQAAAPLVFHGSRYHGLGEAL